MCLTDREWETSAAEGGEVKNDLTMLLNDTERRVDGGKLYLLAVDTIYHLRALVRSAPFAPPAPPSAPAETEGERLRREAHRLLDQIIDHANEDAVVAWTYTEHFPEFTDVAADAFFAAARARGGER